MSSEADNAGQPVTLTDIQAAAKGLEGRIIATPTVPAPDLSGRLNLDTHLKLENLQYTGSFKPRGALNRLMALDAKARERGVIANSAGNHAQGVAFRARELGIPATIVMPEDTPFTKVERTARFGARVVLQGDGLEAAGEYAQELVEREGLTLIHPYDHPLVVAGQGTVALEMLAAVPDLETLVLPIGGGGLCGGCAVAAKGLRPGIRVVGVQSRTFPSMYNAVKGGQQPVGGPTLAEGIAIKQPGQVTRPLIERYVDDILVVEEAAIESAVELLCSEAKIVSEGAGAAGVAALLSQPALFTGQRLGVVICGGNVDARVLSSILLRSLVRQGRIVRLRVVVPDVPGMLARATHVIGEQQGNVIEVQHQRLFHDIAVKQTEIDFLIETRDRHHIKNIMSGLNQAGIQCELLDPQTLESDPSR